MAICKFKFEVNGLASDVFEVMEFSGEEGISRIFRFELDLLSTDKELDFAEIVNKPATLGMQREPGGQESFFRGLVVDFQQYGQTRDKARYQVTFMPRIWRLSYTYQSCVFQNKTVETIIGDVLAEHGFAEADIQFKLVGDYAERDFCVQYRETDLDFICRLMEFEGMYFYFDHSQEQEVLVISDDRSNEEFVRDAQDSVVGYQPPEGLLPLDDVETVNEFVYKEQIVTGKVILKDYNYRDSEMPLKGEATFNPEMPGMFYSYGSHFKDNEQGNRLAQVRNQEFECQRRTAEGRSDCIGLSGGYKMGLQGHYREDLNADYLLTRVRHRGQMIEGQGSYSNEFNTIPFEVQYRPERLTPEPRLPGILTAKVEGADENNQYASIDELGRYQVRLPFDQGDESLGSASKPIRLMQPSSGAGHGMHFPVHAGAEMIWACVDGNVDRPIGLGTVPNSSQVSPVTSENNNENLLQTSSGNRLSMDDNSENPTLTLGSLMPNATSSSGGNGLMGGMSTISSGVKIEENTLTMDTAGITLQTPKTNLFTGKTLSIVHSSDLLLLGDSTSYPLTAENIPAYGSDWTSWAMPIISMLVGGALLIRSLTDTINQGTKLALTTVDAAKLAISTVFLLRSITLYGIGAAAFKSASSTQGKTRIMGEKGVEMMSKSGNIAIASDGGITGGSIGVTAAEGVTLMAGYGGVGINAMALGISLQAMQGGIGLTTLAPLDKITLDAPLGAVEITASKLPWSGGIKLAIPASIAMPSSELGDFASIALDGLGIDMQAKGKIDLKAGLTGCYITSLGLFNVKAGPAISIVSTVGPISMTSGMGGFKFDTPGKIGITGGVGGVDIDGMSINLKGVNMNTLATKTDIKATESAIALVKETANKVTEDVKNVKSASESVAKEVKGVSSQLKLVSDTADAALAKKTYSLISYGSDPRCKENISHVGHSPSGLSIYEFDYKSGLGPVGRYRGVMANEIPQSAVIPRAILGRYDAVNYDKVDVDFERLSLYIMAGLLRGLSQTLDLQPAA